MQDKVFYCHRIHVLTLFFMVITVLLFTLARLAFIGQHGGTQLFSPFVGDVFYWGLRADLKVAALMCLPFYMLVIALIGLNFGGGKKAWFSRIFIAYRYVLYVLLLISLLLLVINHFYYFNFQNHIDIFIFDFLSWENTKAVSYSIWQDYPVLPSLLMMAVLAWLLFRCLRYCAYKSGVIGKNIAAKWLKWHIMLMVLLLLLLGRGSVGVFPLMLTHISIGGDVLLTRAVANGPIALAEAWTAWKAMRQLTFVSDEAYQQAYQTWFEGKPVAALVGTKSTAKWQELPNVLVFQMESMGGQLANLHSEQSPLLGRLAKHKSEDIWLNNFLSSTKGTLGSLEKLLANSGMSNVSESSYRKHHFSATPASLFKKMGYHTIFLTGGSKTWSNIHEFLSHQGFDEILDAQDIQQALPHAEHDGVWGVFDAFSFAYVLQLLQEKHDKPLFIYTMTMTNHSPYILPEAAKLQQFTLPKSWQDKVFQGDADKAELVLQSYHYSADQLGGLMDNIKGSAWRDKTIVAATGDHYMRDIFNYYTEEADILYQYQVPLYLYLPPALRADTYYDAQRFGSHKDIFPTIFARLLSENPLHTGQDLLTKAQGVAISEEFAMGQQGAVLKLGQQAQYYQWQDDSYQILQQTATPTPDLETLFAKHQAYKVLLGWQSQQDVQAQAQP